MKSLLKSIPKPILWISFAVIFILLLGILAFNPLRVLSLQARAGRLIDAYIQEYAPEHLNNFTCQLPVLTQLPGDERLIEAVTLLETARGIRPDDPQTNLLLGQAYCLQENYFSAIVAFETFNQSRPDNPLGKLEMAFAHQALAESENEISEIERTAHEAESRRILEELGLDWEDFFSQDAEEN